MKKIDYLYIAILMVLNFIIRYIASYGKTAYENIDSYHFLGIDAPYDFLSLLTYYDIHNYFIYPAIFLTFIIFYITARKLSENEHTAFLAALLFSLSTIVFINTKFLMIDKNIFSLLMIIAITAAYIHDKPYLTGLLIILFAFIWKGGLFMLIMYYIWEVLRKNRSLIYRVIVSIFLFGVLLLSYKNIIELIYAKDFIGELYAWIILPEYVFVFMAISLIRLKERVLVPFIIISFTAALYMFRFSIFLPVPLYLFIAKKAQLKHYMYIMPIALAIFLASFPSYANTEQIDNRAITTAMDYVNSQNTTCVISTWPLGHIYDYYTNKTVYYKGHSNNIQEQLDYLVYNNRSHNCSIIFIKEDMKAIDDMIIKTGNRNVSYYWIQYQDYKEFIYKHKLTYNHAYVLIDPQESKPLNSRLIGYEKYNYSEKSFNISKIKIQ